MFYFRAVVNFINNLRAAFAPIFLCQKKITKPNCNKRKAAQNTLLQKSCSKNVDEIADLIKISNENASDGDDEDKAISSKRFIVNSITGAKKVKTSIEKKKKMLKIANVKFKT